LHLRLGAGTDKRTIDMNAKGRTMSSTLLSPLVELAHRENDGIAITLVWDTRGDSRTVFVLDSRSGELLTVPVERDNALDVFYHPFAYAATRELEVARAAA
jgi:carotenoid cleavage dioxygenase-like enzyme